MSVYLAWSVYKLVMVVATLLYAALLVLSFNTKKMRIKKSLLTLGVGSVIILFTAVNIGDRQVDLKRQSFDSKPPENVVVEKNTRQRLDRDEVKRVFEQSVKRTE